MAMKKCPECKNDISSKAKSCPHCGYSKPEPQKFGCGSIIVLALVAFFLIGIFSDNDDTSSTESSEPKTAEERRKEKVESAFSAWDGSHRNLERYIKQRLKDPDSYEHMETRYGDQGDVIVLYMKYRAQNSFGGYVIEEATGRAKVDGTLISVNGTPVQ